MKISLRHQPVTEDILLQDKLEADAVRQLGCDVILDSDEEYTIVIQAFVNDKPDADGYVPKYGVEFMVSDGLPGRRSTASSFETLREARAYFLKVQGTPPHKRETDSPYQ